MLCLLATSAAPCIASLQLTPGARLSCLPHSLQFADPQNQGQLCYHSNDAQRYFRSTCPRTHLTTTAARVSYHTMEHCLGILPRPIRCNAFSRLSNYGGGFCLGGTRHLHGRIQHTGGVPSTWEIRRPCLPSPSSDVCWTPTLLDVVKEHFSNRLFPSSQARWLPCMNATQEVALL